MSRADITEADEWFTGEDTGLVFTVRDKQTGAVMNITGWTIEWKLSDTQAGEPIAEIAATLTTPLLGVCTVVIPSAITIDRTPATYYYDLRRIDLGSFAVLAYGSIILRDPFVDEDPW